MGVDFSVDLVRGVKLDRDELAAALEVLDPDGDFGPFECVDLLAENGVDTGAVVVGFAGSFWGSVEPETYLYISRKRSNLVNRQEGGYLDIDDDTFALTFEEQDSLYRVALELGQSNPRISRFVALLYS